MAMGLGAVGAFGAVGSARFIVVVNSESFDALTQFFFLVGSFALSLDLSFAFTVGRFGFFEGIDNVLALNHGLAV